MVITAMAAARVVVLLYPYLIFSFCGDDPARPQIYIPQYNNISLQKKSGGPHRADRARTQTWSDETADETERRTSHRDESRDEGLFFSHATCTCTCAYTRVASSQRRYLSTPEHEVCSHAPKVPTTPGMSSQLCAHDERVSFGKHVQVWPLAFNARQLRWEATHTTLPRRASKLAMP